MSKILRVFKGISVFLVAILTFSFFEVNAAFAHVPHDVISELEISPTYDQDQTLFIYSHSEGGLFKSEDGGKNWKIVKGLDNKKYRLSSLDIYYQSKKTLFLSSPGDGILKSQDEGNSWIKVNQGLGTLNIDLVSISPDSPNVVLAAGTEKGLYQTKNGGESWDQVLDGDSKITAIDFSSDQKDYIVIGDRQGILYESNDGGEGWKQVFTLPQSGVIRTIAISPNFSSDQTFFVGTEKGGIFKTVDGGISFKEVDEGLSDPSIMSLAISPNYKIDSTLFASTWQEGVFYSNNGGNTWQKYSKGLTKASQADKWEKPHFRDLRISSTFSQDKTIFLGGFNGLFKSENGGSVWREIDFSNAMAGIITGIALSPDYRNDSTVAITTHYKGAYIISNDQGITKTAINKIVAPHYPGLLKHNNGIGYLTGGIVFSPNYRSDKTIFSGFFGNFLISKDGGEHWKKISLNNKFAHKFGRFFGRLNNPKRVKLSDSEFAIAVSPNFGYDKTIYLGMFAGGIFRSTDGGASFSVVGDLGQVFYSLVISPDFSSDKTLYAGGLSGVYKTVDGGYTWQPASNGISPLKGGVSNLVISPSYQVDKTVFAGTKNGLFETKDGGESWLKLAGNAWGDGRIQVIAISPNYQSERTFIVGVKGRGLFKTVNGGKTFSRIGDDFIELMQFSPSYSIDQTIYGSSGTELFKSTDGGNTWETMTIPLSNYNYLTRLYLRLTYYLTNSLKLRFLAALIAALLSYLLLGYLGLEKRLPLKKLQIRAGGAFAAFIVVLILLSA